MTGRAIRDGLKTVASRYLGTSGLVRRIGLVGLVERLRSDAPDRPALPARLDPLDVPDSPDLPVLSTIFASIVALIAVGTASAADVRLKPDAPYETAYEAEPVTFTKDVAPLIFDRCAMCHHTAGPAPFNLITYGDVRQHAQQIAVATKNRYMPPWKAEPGYGGEFVGQHPLTDHEIDLLQRWIADGAVEGDRRDLPAAPQWTEGWQLGKPDLVITPSASYTLKGDGTDVFRVFVIPIPVNATRYVRGLEFRPGNPKVVHHANIRIDRTRASRTLDDADPAPGYEGLIPRSAEYPDGHFLGWTPGQVAPLLPTDLSWRLDANTDLVVEIHMQPSGKPEPVQPSIGFYFGDAPPTRSPAMLRLGKQNIDIPAGEQDHVITDSYVLPVDVEVQAVQPHAHYRLREVRGIATLPDGSTRWLIFIKDWDFRWQHVYRYVKPFTLPKGTTLSMRYVYDNSTSNARNPEHPPRRATWGQRSSDEMGDLWIQVLTKNEQDLITLGRSFRPKVAAEDVLGYESEIRRDPSSDALHDDAAMLYLELGRADEAVRHFKTSLELKPQSPAAHFNFGTALSMAGRVDEAIAEYRAALQLRPDYAAAHNNLGASVLQLGNVDDALTHLRDAVRSDPMNAEAHRNLASLLATTRGRPADEAAEAIRVAERAVALTGRRNALTLDVLAAAYASAGQFDRAVRATAAALALSPPAELAHQILQHQALYEQQTRFFAR